MPVTCRADASPLTRAGFLAAQGVLLVRRPTPPPPAPVKGQPAAVPGNPAEGDEILIAVWDDGSVTGLSGHVDLGTGIQTALAQIVADELDVALAQVRMVLGDTARAPNQGATIASASIQIHAQPLRLAAAQARRWLIERAAKLLGVPGSELSTAAGKVAGDGRTLSYGELLSGPCTILSLDLATPIKRPQDYRVVGRSQPRVDIPSKLAGDLVFVHDMRLPGMLHGRVVRPPYAGADHGEFIGNTLDSVDESSIAHIPGIRAVVVIRDFVGIVAEREEHAEKALRALRVRWKSWPGMPELNDPARVAQAIRDNPATQRTLVDEGDVDAALAVHGAPLRSTYLWPYQLHASIGPSCAVAEWQPADGPAALRVWAGSQNPHVLRADLAKLMGLDEVMVDVVRMEAAGCYGRNGADDVAADAALLARAAGAPVRVQLTREQEHAWEPQGAAQLMQVAGALSEDGSIAAYDFETSYPSNGAPTLALLLTRTIEPVAQAYEMGDRTARPPYVYDNLRVKVNDMAPIVRASWLRGVSALPNSFAHESFIDEMATAAGVDPVQFRLRHLHDPRAVELLQATAQKAGWRMRTGPQENADGGLGSGGDVLFGQGVAYARYVHSKWPGFGAAWAAWVADVEVNRKTGEVHVRRVVVGHDAGLVVNPSGVEHQVHGNVIQTTSRALKEQVRFAPASDVARSPDEGLLPGVLPTGVVASREWGGYPIINFREVPVIEVLQMPRPGEAPMGAGESASVPGTAAIANAIFDATGVRFRSPPFTPEVVRAALNPLEGQPDEQPQPRSKPERLPLPPGGAGGEGNGAGNTNAAAPSSPPSPGGRRSKTNWPRRKGILATTAALFTGTVALLAGLLGWRSTIAPVTFSTPAYSTGTIERGRRLAAAGDCVVCHTAPGGTPNAGGRAMETPFGTIHTTNLTPDPDTGLGQWSFSAFQRAMREGISRDGHYLYPAFPYTAFAKTTDDDLQALYAYLQSLPPVKAATPANDLRFPFNLRPLMAGWNALYHDAKPYKPVTTQSAEWNRGAYLVNGLGHCGACHTPRDALGAERTGKAYLSGATVDGWEAPALTSLSQAPVPWTAQSVYDYLRHGYSREHGSANGPMAPVVRELAVLPDADVRAMAGYLASFDAAAADATARPQLQAQAEPPAQAQAQAQAWAQTQALAQAVIAHSRTAGRMLPDASQRLFDGACGACHHDGSGPQLLGVNVPLALSSKLHSASPDNLVQVLLEGVREPAGRDVGFMPSFADSLSDQQIAELAGYMRARYAPGKPAWTKLPEQVAKLRRLQAGAAGHGAVTIK